MNDCTKAIDFVIAWVDGSDPEWQKQKNEYLNMPEYQTAIEFGAIDAQIERYRSWDNLHYWFRCVEKNAPWVNQIHLITWGHIPDWLNTEHPKLHIVRHEDYIPEEYLPTFSSHPVELHMHRIPGLAEQFVYFNDDMFVTAPTKPEDFFVNGLPCDTLSENPISCEINQPWYHVRLNDTTLLNKHYYKPTIIKELGKKWFSTKIPRALIKNLLLAPINRTTFFGLTPYHLSIAYLKSSFDRMWGLESELLHQTSLHRFRDCRDVSHWCIRENQLVTGQFHPYNMYKLGRAYYDDRQFPFAAEAIRKRQHKVICINDSANIDFQTTKSLINTAFADTYPNKSSFEC